MGGMVLFIFYGSILFFVVASILRWVKFASAPLHLRWELYEGSSIYELTDWWTKTENRLGKKLRSMAWNILFLKEFYRRNRRFWYPLYAFHLGIYLLILWHAWLFVSAVSVEAESASSLGWTLGTFATASAFIGGAGILLMRVRDVDLRVYYPPIHYLKWLFILLTLAGGIYSVDVHFHSSTPALLKYVRAQVTFADLENKLHPALGPALHVLFASVWLIYLPFSHVFQLFFRYYHYLRWDDVPNRRGSEIERRIKDLLQRPVTWSGPHIPGGKRWSEVASEATITRGADTK